MGILDGIFFGTASEVSSEAIAGELSPILIRGETVKNCYKIVRDLIASTEHRIILIDKQGMTGKKIDFHTIPYRSNTHYSVETSGLFDIDSELKIRVTGRHEPIEKKFSPETKIKEIRQLLSIAVLKWAHNKD